jgi:hypothetical protein
MTTQMTEFDGRLTKLSASAPHLSELPNFLDARAPLQGQVDYHLRLLNTEHGELDSILRHQIPLNEYVGHSIKIEFLGKISCLYCGRRIKKTYSDGYCYPCFMERPSAAECIIRPALCLAHEGGGRDPEWERAHHLQTHYVYMVRSSKYKVGVTRDWPTRWLDQGADAVKVIASLPYRQLAGLIELELAQHYSDKLSWQAMLKGECLKNANLDQEVRRAISLLSEDLAQYGTPESPIISFNYPIQTHPLKVKSVKLDKVDELEGRLEGIKGQYLIFDQNRVINIRSHSAYHVRVHI